MILTDNDNHYHNYKILFGLQIFSITFNNQQLRKFNGKKTYSKNGVC